MFDRVFSAALVFGVLAGGTLAVATAMLEQPRSEAQIVQLPRVEVFGKRNVAVAEATEAAQAAAATLQQ